MGYINQLPEECISHVISFTTPRDACVASAVSRAFRSAADSDITWQRFLPSDCAAILSRAANFVADGPKKELYFRLCVRPLLIDEGSMSFELERSSGAKSFMLSARALSIARSDELDYWSWITLHESRFSECAELHNVRRRLKIIGTIDIKILTPNTPYTAYLIFKSAAQRRWGLSDPFQIARNRIAVAGVTVSQRYVRISYRDRSQRSMRINYSERYYKVLKRRLPGASIEEIISELRLPREREDGWMEVDLGEFDSGDGIDGEVLLSLMEIMIGIFKCRLIVQGIEVRPNARNRQ